MGAAEVEETVHVRIEASITVGIYLLQLFLFTFGVDNFLDFLQLQELEDQRNIAGIDEQLCEILIFQDICKRH